MNQPYRTCSLRKRLPLAAAIVALSVSQGYADVRMPALFSDHMVLQADEQVPIWGWADPGEAVKVEINGKSYSTKAGADGRWMLGMNLKDSSAGPFELGVSGKNRLTIKDVLVGQVWLASGQSNMERLLKQTADADQEVAGSSNSMIRQFKIPRTASETPAVDCKGEWVLAGPRTSGDFTAVGYYFAKRLWGDLGVPVGIINSTWGGTFSEAWTSEEFIAKVPSLAAGADVRKQRRAEYPEEIKAFREKFAAWLEQTGRMDKHADITPFVADSVSETGWTQITLPGKIEGSGLPEYGMIWLRKEFEVPEAAKASGLNVFLGEMKGFEAVYWNGQKISETTPEKFTGEGMPRICGIPSRMIRPGKNVMALRIYAPSEKPVIRANPQSFNAGPINMAGAWQAKAEYSLPELAALSPAPTPPRQFVGLLASELYNGMIAPLIPCRLAGVIWYQGEANRGRAWEYRESFPLLINDWRKQWGRVDMPFYFCQLANFTDKLSAPAESSWAEAREAQSLALSLPATGQAVLIDIGEAKDIHPLNKKDAGERLARIALAKNYGKDIVFSGPVYDSMSVEDKAIRIRFTHVEKGLVARPLPAQYDVSTIIGKTAPLVRNSPGSELEGFAICGADHKWVWANAKIDGGAVVVWSDKVPAPVAVRYAWADNPTCNLYNGAGLPASPFRTDNFPASTKGSLFGPNS